MAVCSVVSISFFIYRRANSAENGCVEHKYAIPVEMEDTETEILINGMPIIKEDFKTIPL